MKTTLALLLLAAPAAAADAGPYAAGTLTGTISAGNSEAGHWIVGAGAGYYVYDGLQAELDLSYWFAEEPNAWGVSPGARFVLWFIPVVHPYAGLFYRRLFVEDSDAIDSAGWRGGVSILSGRTIIDAGLRYERVLDCEGDCEAYSPEIGFGVTF